MICLSSAEAEFNGVVAACSEAMFFKQILEFHGQCGANTARVRQVQSASIPDQMNSSRPWRRMREGIAL